MEEESTISGDEAGGQFLRVLPDLKVCHTKPIATIASLADCLVDNPITCPHAVFSGKSHFCTHPQWKDFVGEVRRERRE